MHKTLSSQIVEETTLDDSRTTQKILDYFISLFLVLRNIARVRVVDQVLQLIIDNLNFVHVCIVHWLPKQTILKGKFKSTNSERVN